MERPKIGRPFAAEGSRGSPSVKPCESPKLSPLTLNVIPLVVATETPRSNLVNESN